MSPTAEAGTMLPLPASELSLDAARAQLALDAAGVGAWDWDIERGVRTWDAQARAIFGLGPDVAISPELIRDLFHPEDHAAWTAQVQRFLDAEMPELYDGEYRIRLPDGRERWIHTRGRVLWGDGPAGRQPKRFLGTVRDITERRVAELALAEREERLRAALHASRTGTFRWDIRTNALDWDENLDRLFGLAPGSTVRSLDAFVAMVHPDDRARVIAACARCADIGADFDEEFRVVWPDGSIHWLDDKGRTFPDSSGAPAYMTGACVEITDRKRADAERERIAAALRASEARLRRIMESGIAGAFFWHIDGGITDANDAFLDLLGFTRDDLRAGRIDWRALTPESWRESDAVHVAQLLATGRHGPYEKEYFAKDGRRVPVLVSSAFFEGSRESGVAICIDLTVRRQALAAAESARREAEQARAQAEAANQAKSAFLATMSHELRTPLNAIGGYVDLIRLGIRGPTTAEQREDLDRIRRSQAHLLGLINDVLNFAKLDAGAVRFEIAELHVDEQVAAAEAMIAPQMAAKGLRYASAPSDPTLTVRADAEKLRQVLLNLLTNALKFTDAGGAVSLSWRDQGDRIALDVRDTGCGIPADRIESIFEPFVQVDRQLSRPSDGVGLGLAISRELARGMGGDLTVESRIGEGSTFTLTLPRG